VFIKIKDKLFGVIIVLMGFLIAFGYTLGSVIDFWLTTDIFNDAPNPDGFIIPNFPDIFDWRFFVVITLWLFMMFFSIIAIWIGYNMLKISTPVPLEAFEEKLATEEVKN
jgi:hypothetical protein